jgi:hypothetical protein
MKIPSEKIYPYLEALVDKPLGPWKSREEIDGILRRRLTKKEYRLFLAELEGAPLGPLMEKLRLDEERAAAMRESIRKKLNRDSIKRELCGAPE